MKVQALSLSLLLLSTVGANAITLPVALGAADSYAVIAASAVTNTGPTSLHGDIGVWPGTAITGFPSSRFASTSDAAAMAAQTDLTTAYNNVAGQSCGTNLTGTDLGGLMLTPGVYCFSSSAQLTGTLTLNALGDANALFLFQIGSTLTTASASSVLFTGGGNGDSVFWQVGSSATLGTTTAFAGNILALTSITATTGATIQCGRALARNGAVTLDSNVISIDTPDCETSTSTLTPVVEPDLSLLFGLGGAMVLVARRRA